MSTATVTTKGQIVIPSKIRQRLKIKRGTKLCITERGDQIIIQPLTSDYFGKMAGILPTEGKLSKTLLEERAKDKDREA
ncbi:AbrB/MazE/SpoVT family DNA-binding domain-containing protein [bacterium]|nr:AbrB/MazE/SpoVT family DNA-binding domain-containing protein [bacterium]